MAGLRSSARPSVAASLRQAERDLSRIGPERARRREELLSSVSHELRTPLSSVIGYTEVLLNGDAGTLSEQQAAMLVRVATNGERLLHLIEGLLAAACAAGQGDQGVVDVMDVFGVVCQGPDGPPAPGVSDVHVTKDEEPPPCLTA